MCVQCLLTGLNMHYPATPPIIPEAERPEDQSWFYWDDEDPSEIIEIQENAETFVNRNKLIRAIDE